MNLLQKLEQINYKLGVDRKDMPLSLRDFLSHGNLGSDYNTNLTQDLTSRSIFVQCFDAW